MTALVTDLYTQAATHACSSLLYLDDDYYVTAGEEKYFCKD